MNSLHTCFHLCASNLSDRQSHDSTLPRLALAVLFLGASLFILGPCAFGQSLGTAGTIGGKVTDPSGAPVANARVSLFQRSDPVSAGGRNLSLR